MILALDPGIRGSGVALLHGSTITGSVQARPDGMWHPVSVDHTTARLKRVAYLRNPATGLTAAAAACMALEIVKWARAQGPFPAEPAGDLLAVEWPQVYQGGKQKGDPNDLLPLAGIDAALAALFANVPECSYHPREWKGQVDKDTCHARIFERLTTEEVTRLEIDLHTVPGALRHNAMDAVGVGLKAAGRFEPRKVFARVPAPKPYKGPRCQKCGQPLEVEGDSGLCLRCTPG